MSLEDVRGVGAVTAEKLRQAGITTPTQLSVLRPEEVKALGIVNSKLLSYLFRNCLITNPVTYPYSQHYDLEKLPIRQIDFKSPTDNKPYRELVTLVERMLQLNEQIALIDTSACAERDELLREIEHCDAEIDRRVYELYGITEEERQIIETSTYK